MTILRENHNGRPLTRNVKHAPRLNFLISAKTQPTVVVISQIRFLFLGPRGSCLFTLGETTYKTRFTPYHKEKPALVGVGVGAWPKRPFLIFGAVLRSVILSPRFSSVSYPNFLTFRGKVSLIFL